MKVALQAQISNGNREARFYTITAHYRVLYYENGYRVGSKYCRNLNKTLALGIAWVTSEQNREDASPSS